MSGIYKSKNLSELSKQLAIQKDQPTKILNQYLLRGATKSELEEFLRRNLTRQFSWEENGWIGLVNHITWTEQIHGWTYNVNIREFVASACSGDIIKLIDINYSRKIIGRTTKKQVIIIPQQSCKKTPVERKTIAKKLAATDNKTDRLSSSQNTNVPVSRLLTILEKVHAQILGKVESLGGMIRFRNSGIEAWFKVEVQAVLGRDVNKLNNKGPDLLLSDGLQVELKGATNFSPTWFRNGALKYNCPCLFLGHSHNQRPITALHADKQVALVGLKELADTGWYVGMIIPRMDSLNTNIGKTHVTSNDEE